MTIRSLRRYDSEDEALNQLQDHLQQFMQQIYGIELLDGVLINEISFSAGVDTVINHGLDRVYGNFIATFKDADGNIFESPTQNINKNRVAILRSGASMTANIWFF